jgi:succinate-semialdehyde dehydrogenase / glutarate-semialdehyde dehydrogenase
MDVRNPRTGKPDVTDPANLAEICRGLALAQPDWAARSWQERVEILEIWVAAVTADTELLQALSKDTGRYRLAAGEIGGVPFVLSQWSRFAADVFVEPPSAALLADPDVSFTTQLFPYPVVGVISPWNFPLLLSLLDSLAALVAGCAVIVKPSEITPRFVAPLQKTIEAIPELCDVFAFVVGDGVLGAELINNVDTVCFTGSVATGRKVAAAAASNMIPAHLELGGKDPVVVLASADVAKAASLILRASVQATGQACQSLERIYVDRTIYPQFLAALTAEAERVELNSADLREGHLGPIIMEGQAAIIQSQINAAVAAGAKIVTGGQIENHGGGLWIRPTVLTGVTQAMEVIQEETFGPVLPVMAFDTVEEAIQLANDSQFGLSAAVFGDEREATEVALQLNGGAVSINDGGLTTIAFEAEKDSYGLSGLGSSRMGASGLKRFLRKKAIITRHAGGVGIESFRENRD